MLGDAGGIRCGRTESLFTFSQLVTVHGRSGFKVHEIPQTYHSSYIHAAFTATACTAVFHRKKFQLSASVLADSSSCVS